MTAEPGLLFQHKLAPADGVIVPSIGRTTRHRLTVCENGGTLAPADIGLMC
jgi:hypothetical protein